MKPAFTGGALSFKGESKKKKVKKKKSKSKHSLKDETGKAEVPDEEASQQQLHADDDLTEAERKALHKKREREQEELKKVARKSHRERVEEFNEKLVSQSGINNRLGSPSSIISRAHLFSSLVL